MTKPTDREDCHVSNSVTPNSSETVARIVAFLDAHHVVSLATCSANGPHAANVFYARDGFALLWVSDPASRHSAELEVDARVAATIAPDYFDFDDILGVQISGHARRVIDASECAKARGLLEARYPFLNRLSEGPPALREAYARADIYRLEPARLVIIDNSQGFGHKETLEFAETSDSFSRCISDERFVRPKR